MHDEISVSARENRAGQDVDVENDEWQGSFVDPNNGKQSAHSTDIAGTAASFPQHIVNDGAYWDISGIRCELTRPAVRDDALKNLMMSWYWAGYYTGLHHGKQQSQIS